MSNKLSTYHISLKFFHSCLASQDQVLLGQSIDWLEKQRTFSEDGELDRNISYYYLHQMLFEGLAGQNTPATWLFDNDYGYELEAENGWQDYCLKKLSESILAICAQSDTFGVNSEISIRHFHDAHSRLKLNREQEILWHYILRGRPLVTEIASGSQEYYYHTFLNNTEIKVILSSLPEIEVLRIEFEALAKKELDWFGHIA